MIEIRVNNPTVDVIHVSSEKDVGWKLDGFLGEELSPPDELQDHFWCIVNTLAEYVDADSVWTNMETGQRILPWDAMVLLTKVDD